MFIIARLILFALYLEAIALAYESHVELEHIAYEGYYQDGATKTITTNQNTLGQAITSSNINTPIAATISVTSPPPVTTTTDSCLPTAFYPTNLGTLCQIQSDDTIQPFNQLPQYKISILGWAYAVLAEDFEVQLNITSGPKGPIVSAVAFRCSVNETFQLFTFKNSLATRTCLDETGNSLVGGIVMQPGVDPSPHVHIQEIRYLGSKGLGGLCYGETLCNLKVVSTGALPANNYTIGFKSSLSQRPESNSGNAISSVLVLILSILCFQMMIK